MRSASDFPTRPRAEADRDHPRTVNAAPSPCPAAAISPERALIARGLPDHIAGLWRFALVRCADRALADDLVQATCVRALERADQFTPGSRLDHWLFAILDSIWQNLRRAQGVRSGNGLIDAAEAELVSGDSDEETRLHLIDTVRLIAALPEAQRSVLLLVCVEGMSYQEVARTLAIPIGTVMSRLSSARARMRLAFGA